MLGLVAQRFASFPGGMSKSGEQAVRAAGVGWRQKGQARAADPEHLDPAGFQVAGGEAGDNREGWAGEVGRDEFRRGSCTLS